MGNFSVKIYFSGLLSPFTRLWCITRALTVHFVENGDFDHQKWKMTVTSTTIIEFSWDVYFWLLQTVRFHMIYNKSYDHLKFKIMISESIGRFFLTRLSSHVNRKRKRGKSNGICNSISNIPSEITKIFYVRILRFPSVAYSIIWTISWPSDRIPAKKRK